METKDFLTKISKDNKLDDFSVSVIFASAEPLSQSEESYSPIFKVKSYSDSYAEVYDYYKPISKVF